MVQVAGELVLGSSVTAEGLLRAGVKWPPYSSAGQGGIGLTDGHPDK